MSKLMSMFSGTKARQGEMAAQMKAETKRQELGALEVSDEERKAAGRTRDMARRADGRASTRLSDSILGGRAPLG